jgi:hypothetical protein
MVDVKTAASTETLAKTLSSKLGPSNLADDQGKRNDTPEIVERRDTKLEDGISGANETPRPMIDIQEYFVRVKIRRKGASTNFAGWTTRY